MTPLNRIAQRLAPGMDVQPSNSEWPGRDADVGPQGWLTAPTWALYQAAARQAQRDYELNRLFNPDFYRDAPDRPSMD